MNIESSIPVFDRVLVRILPRVNVSLIATPSISDEPSLEGKVIATGSHVYMGGQMVPIPFKAGDTVRFGANITETATDYGADKSLAFIRAGDVRCYWPA